MELYRNDITRKFNDPDVALTLLNLQFLSHWLKGSKLWYQDRLIAYQIFLSFIRVAAEMGFLQVIGSTAFDTLLDSNAIERSMCYSLDTEGENLVTFRYESFNSRFYFLVPYRVAEQFLSPALLVDALRIRNQNCEDNRFNGQPIGTEDGLAYPVDSLLQSLLEDVYEINIFPCGLSEPTEEEQEEYYGGSRQRSTPERTYWRGADPYNEDYYTVRKVMIG